MSWFSDRKIFTKVFVLVAFLLVFVMVTAFQGYDSLKVVRKHAENVSVNLREGIKERTLLEMVMAINTVTDDVSANAGTPSVISENKAIYEESRATFTKLTGELRQSLDDREKESLDRVEAAYKDYLPFVDAVFEATRHYDPSAPDASLSRMNDIMKRSEEPAQKLTDTLKEMIDQAELSAQDAEAKADSEAGRRIALLLAGACAALVTGFSIGSFIAVSQIARPLARTTGILNALMNNNLDVAVEGVDRKDEIGDVARAALNFKEILIKNRAGIEAEKEEQVKKAERQKRIEALISGFDSTATQTVSAVSTASTELSGTAEAMSKVAEETNHHSVEVASASEQASHNVQSVASAAEEMAATVQEISRQIAMSNGIVRSAMEKAEAADASSKELVEMSRSVGAIATLIEDIAGQINLLALNATIESARSGEAGKGFAVVANEVKNLATQTAKATEQIRQQLEGVQQTATGVAGMLGEVKEAIARVDEGSSAIAAAVEEQSAATQEIVSNMNTATQGVEMINSGIFTIKGGTDSTTAATRQVLDAARLLSAQAEKMDAEVKTFLKNIVAA